jgi:hypothetical protein
VVLLEGDGWAWFQAGMLVGQLLGGLLLMVEGGAGLLGGVPEWEGQRSAENW